MRSWKDECLRDARRQQQQQQQQQWKSKATKKQKRKCEEEEEDVAESQLMRRMLRLEQHCAADAAHNQTCKHKNRNRCRIQSTVQSKATKHKTKQNKRRIGMHTVVAGTAGGIEGKVCLLCWRCSAVLLLSSSSDTDTDAASGRFMRRIQPDAW